MPARLATEVGSSRARFNGDDLSYNMSPWNVATSPFIKSPWTHSATAIAPISDELSTGIVGSVICEEGRLYSVAAFGDLLYTGSDSKNIHVQKT